MTTTLTPENENARRQPGAIENDDDSGFSGALPLVSSPRELRLLAALLSGPKSRETLDRRIGASNTPDVVFRLRQRGFEVPCRLVKGTDRDGRACHYGEYRMTDADARKAALILSEQGA